MIKAGLLGAIVGFIYVMSITLVSPFCTLCITPLLGVIVGYLAGQIDKPLKLESSLSRGGIAGGMTGCGALLGQMLAAVVNGILVTNWRELPNFVRELGLTQFPNTDEYWQTTLTANSFCSVLNLVLIAGLGIVGGLIWFQRQHRKTLPGVSF
jgi:MFS family permease